MKVVHLLVRDMKSEPSVACCQRAAVTPCVTSSGAKEHSVSSSGLIYFRFDGESSGNLGTVCIMDGRAWRTRKRSTDRGTESNSASGKSRQKASPERNGDDASGDGQFHMKLTHIRCFHNTKTIGKVSWQLTADVRDEHSTLLSLSCSLRYSK